MAAQDNNDEIDDIDDIDDIDFNLHEASDYLLGKRKDDPFDFSRDGELKKYYHEWKNWFGLDGDEGNILHRVMKKMDEGDIDQQGHLKDAIIMIVEAHPQLIWTDQRGHDNTMPLWLAVEKKRDKLIMAFMKGLEKSQRTVSHDMREALKQPVGSQGRTVIHKGIEINLDEVAIQAILDYASEDILALKDTQGRTPLHLAVNYGDCTADRVVTIRKMLQRCRSSLTITDNSDDSIYIYHLRTEDEWKTQISLKEASDAKAIKQDATKVDPKLESKGLMTGSRAQQENERDPKGANKAKQSQSHKQRDHDEVPRRNIDTQKEARHGSKRIPEAYEQDKSIPTNREARTMQHGEGVPNRGTLDIGMDQHPRPNQGSRREPASSPTTGLSRTLSFQPDMEGGQRAQSLKNQDNEAETAGQSPRRGARTGVYDERREKERLKRKKRRDEENKIKERERAKRTKEELEKNSKSVKLEIKLRCMRTLSPKQTSKVLYGNNSNGVQICFGFPRQSKIRLSSFIASFNNVKFDPVLQYVAFPSSFVLIESEDEERSSGMRLGRRDMVEVFKWLRETKGVKRIIKVIVNDFDSPSHTDSAIMKCLVGLQVEDLQWLKVDMDPTTILNISRSIRDIRLRWSGSNTTLRAWSDPYGLRKLEHLRTVHLDLAGDEVLESHDDTKRNIKKFTYRLNTRHNSAIDENNIERPPKTEDIKVSCSGMEIFHKKAGVMTGSGREMNNTHTENHKWLSTMDKFSQSIDQVWNKAQDLAKQSQLKAWLAEPIVVALIDDGVDLLDPSLQGRHCEGKSLSYDMEDINKPTEQREHAFWDPSGDHGTVMANLIFRVCPMVKLYVIRMETHVDDENHRRITARSAAEAIKAAVEKKVNIISMSWTIGQTDESASADLKNAIASAHDADILMFASSSDGGHYTENSWPVAINRDAFFRIGAAQPDGKPYGFAGPVSALNYTFPGVDVFKSSSQFAKKGDSKLQQRLAEMKTETGSSVATALAAGTAAMVLTCMRIGAIVGNQESSTCITPHVLENMQKRNNMIVAFDRLGTRLNDNKFIEVWETLDTTNWSNFRDGRPLDKMKAIDRIFSNFVPPSLLGK
ncbi:hypothetical protein E8E14_008762 [Neopestalotiopsis sp. 37M]|nr:hypothetical protein E8E14_008762 [Neopestalotiopsis sp. 37M]